MSLISRIIAIVAAALLFWGGAVFAQEKDAIETLPPEALRYQLGSGDQVKVVVYGEEDLSGEFELDGTGIVALPLIGPVNIGGKDLSDAEMLITEKLADGFLVSPRVSIEILNYRPFYILGEVKEPGSYPYVSGMTVLNAIALASGFTYRASESKIEVTRKIDGVEKKFKIDITAAVLPGDILRIQERFF